jgi:hypothetical protein
MRASTDEMEQYLRSAAEDAKQAEARALAKADEGGEGSPGVIYVVHLMQNEWGCGHFPAHAGACTGGVASTTADKIWFAGNADFTPAWRNVGLPLKPSHLHLDRGAMAGARLVNPKAIVQVREPSPWARELVKLLLVKSVAGGVTGFLPRHGAGTDMQLSSGSRCSWCFGVATRVLGPW